MNETSDTSFNLDSEKARIRQEMSNPDPQVMPESLEDSKKRIKYDMALEKAEDEGALATFEGAGKGVAGALFTGAEELAYRSTGIESLSPERRRAREEKHGGKQGLAEFATFSASLLYGVGEARLLQKIGEKGVNLLPTASKVLGSKHLQAIIEMGALSVNNQTTKLINQDPSLTVGTAIFDVALSGALGGGMSVGMSKFMNSTLGKKLSQNLKAVSEHYGNIEGAGTDSVDQIEQATGMKIDPVLRGALSSPEGKEVLNKLNQTDTSYAGISAQKKFREFKDSVSENLTKDLGSSVESIPAHYDKYSEGNIIATNASKESKELIDPLVKEFEQIKKEAAEVPLVPDRFEKVQTEETLKNPYLTPKYTELKTPGVISHATDEVLALARKESWDASPSSRIMHEVNRVIRELPLQKNVKNLTGLIRSVSDKYERNPTDGSWNRYLMQLVGTLRDMEGYALELHAYQNMPINTQTKLFAEASDKIQRLQAARRSYAEAGKLLDPLMERVGLEGSLAGFPERLLKEGRENGEGVLKRLSGKNDAYLLEVLQKSFPQTAQSIRQAHVRQILSDAMVDNRLVPERIIKALDDLSPQLRNFVTGEKTKEINALSDLLTEFKNPKHNFSNTSRAAAHQFKLWPATGAALATGLLGHGLIPSAVVGAMSHLLFVEGPDAVRLSMLKWMGSPKNIDAVSFRAMSTFWQRVLKSEEMIKKASKSVFEGAGKIGLEHGFDEYHEQERIDTLDKRLQEFEKDPEKYIEISKNTGYYMPEHGMAITSTLSQAASYVNSKRPKVVKPDLVGTEIEPSEGQKHAFKEVLKIAEQPLCLFAYMKEGTLTLDQVQDLQNMYPGSYQVMAAQLSQDLGEHVAKGKDISYQLKMGISTFLQQPLDSSFEGQNVAENQMVYMQNTIENQQKQARPSKSGMGKSKASKRISLEMSDTA